MTVSLSWFAFEALLGEAGKGPEFVSARVVRGIRIYLRDKEFDRPGWAYPAFLRDQEDRGEVEVELYIEEDLWGELEAEAEMQQISVAQMIEHATLYFAAEENAGRITQRILEKSRNR